MLGEVVAAYIAAHGAALPALPFGPAYYQPAARATSNWRWQAVTHLDLKPMAAISIATGVGKIRIPRCVKLNNYWCIKRAGWAGEIAADRAGHVAFASAREGATVAVNLLRRYYIDYKRTSALAIVSRWAPAQCGLVTVRGTRSGKRTQANLRGLAKRGLGNTLRARWLARHGRGGVAKKFRKRIRRRSRARVVRSAIRSRPLPMLRAPSISPGLGEKRVVITPIRLAAINPRERARALKERPVPRIGCTSEAIRIRNYARRMSAGISNDFKKDLKLFMPDGAPAPNLALVLANMAAVEVGPLRVDPALITAAIRIAEQARQDRR